MYKLYKVGGCIRDKLLGIKSSDIDYTFVFEDSSIANPYERMNEILSNEGFTIFLKVEDMYVTRARFPDSGVVADFTLARKELEYSGSSRMPKLELGTLMDDLVRRDFTINALAEDSDGNIIDMFNGVKHLLEDKVIVPTIDARTSLTDDPLRLLRALRFSVTKNLRIDESILDIINRDDIWDKYVKVVSIERTYTELHKMFMYDTLGSIKVLTRYLNEDKLSIIFNNKLWLNPSLKSRKVSF